jgi:hypothetical protein
MAKTNGLKNGPSKTGKPSGGKRENNPPKSTITSTAKPLIKPNGNK